MSRYRLHFNAVDLTGDRFGRLTAIEPTAARSGKDVVWRCRCECGRDALVGVGNLRSGQILSCGCLQYENRLKHGGASDHGRLPEYQVWTDMRGRCNTPSHASFQRYGARAITICARWNEFANFLSDMGRRPTPQHTIERVDNDAGYSKDNCIWATRKTQGRNHSGNHRITYRGVTRCIAEWAEERGMPASVLSGRLSRGWTPVVALETPYTGYRQPLLTMGGETLTLMAWSRRTGLGHKVIVKRLRRGWSIDAALTTLTRKMAAHDRVSSSHVHRPA